MLRMLPPENCSNLCSSGASNRRVGFFLGGGDELPLFIVRILVLVCQRVSIGQILELTGKNLC